jgi:hypothetical protein
MIWAKRQFRFPEYAPYMERLDKLMLANPSMYSQFIMVSTGVSKPALSNYYVGVPDQSFLAEFDGFDIVPESQLPNKIDTVLLGWNSPTPGASLMLQCGSPGTMT